MDAVTLTQQQQQTASIQGDSFLAEREKQKIHEELEQLQQAKAIEFKEYNAKKEQLTKTVATLKAEKESLEKDAEKAKNDYDRITKSIDDYGENEVEKAKNAVTSIYLTAQSLQKEWKERMIKVDAKVEELEIEDKELTEMNEKVFKLQVENEIKERLLQKQEYQLNLKRDEVKKTVAELEEKRDTLIREVETKQAKVRGLDITTKIQEDYAKKTTEDAEVKMKEATIKMAEGKALEEKNNETSKNLTIEKLQMDDRAVTLRRAYNEIISRGGKIDG